MQIRSRLNLTQTWLGLALPILVLTLAAPPAARADCGDYVVIPAKAGLPYGPMASKDMPGHSQQHSPLGPDAPCSGPNCSRRSLPPAPAPVSTSQQGGEEWGCMPGLPRETDLFSARSSYSVTSLAPLHRGSDIYHPPR